MLHIALADRPAHRDGSVFYAFVTTNLSAC